MTPTDAVRASMAAYAAQDLAAMDALLAEDFRFTSPQDDHIDKAAFLERCFLTAQRFVGEQRLLHIVDLGAGDVFLMYEYELKDGGRFRNTEVITVRDGQLVETQVFFGGQVS